MEKNNVLFVGNGVDLVNGYKTGYVDFLLSYKDQYKNLFINGVKSILDSKIFLIPHMLETESIDTFQFINKFYFQKISLNNTLKKYNISDKALAKDNSNTYQEIQSGVNNSTEFHNMKKKLTKLSTENVFFNISELSNYNKKEHESPNFWITYFMECYIHKELSEKNWIDLEDLILRNAESVSSDNVPLNYTVEHHIEKYFNDDIDLEDEFKKMKILLCKYIERIKKGKPKYDFVQRQYIEKYGTRLIFNYTYPQLLDNHGGSDFYIHGKVEDECDIVFGYDDGMLRDALTSTYAHKSTEFYNYSKTYQLMKLSLNYQNEKMMHGFKLPLKKDIEYIGILGHSIGKADYNYFRTLCDFSKVKIEVFWYEYEVTTENGEVKVDNNRDSLFNNVIKMIHEMERRTQTEILHKMLIEQRIVFREVKFYNEKDN